MHGREHKLYQLIEFRQKRQTLGPKALAQEKNFPRAFYIATSVVF